MARAISSRTLSLFPFQDEAWTFPNTGPRPGITAEILNRSIITFQAAYGLSPLHRIVISFMPCTAGLAAPQRQILETLGWAQNVEFNYHYYPGKGESTETYMIDFSGEEEARVCDAGFVQTVLDLGRTWPEDVVWPGLIS